MLDRAELAAALATVGLGRVDGIWWRAVGHRLLLGPPPGAPPGSRPQPLWAEGASRFGARFTPTRGPPTVYLASDDRTALLEVNAILAIPHGPPLAAGAEPYTMCQVRVSLGRVLDLRAQGVQAALGTNTDEMIANWRVAAATGQRPATHVLGRAAHASMQIAALLSHSAKNAERGAILAVFPDRLVDGDFIEVIDASGTLAQRLPSPRYIARSRMK